MAPHVLYGAKGWTLADSNYWSPDLFERLEKGSLSLLAPSKSKKKSKKEGTKEHKGRWSGLLTRMRRRVETVIGQLTGRSRRQESVGDGPVARLEPVDQKSDQSYDGRFALPT